MLLSQLGFIFLGGSIRDLGNEVEAILCDVQQRILHFLETAIFEAYQPAFLTTGTRQVDWFVSELVVVRLDFFLRYSRGIFSSASPATCCDLLLHLEVFLLLALPVSLSWALEGILVCAG